MKKIFLLLFYFIISFKVFAIEINQEFLNQFDGVAIKKIKKSETIKANKYKTRSEFNGVNSFKNILGQEKKKFNTNFFYISDDEIKKDKLILTWYYYKKSPNNKDRQYFLYYQKKPIVINNMKENDLIFLGRKENELVLAIIKQGTKKEQELLNIFNLVEKTGLETQKQNITTISQTTSPHTDTRNLKKHKDIKIYKNTKTNKIVIVGKITKVKDGDTIVISDLFNVRMFGIDTPEKKQICKDKNNKEYLCGIKATKHLKKISGKRDVVCVNNGIGSYGRFLFVCKNSRYDINQKMVQDGWALSYYNDEYKKDEEKAKNNKKGLWSGEFEIPSEWRKNRKKNKL